jgi:hypothetical protein
MQTWIEELTERVKILPALLRVLLNNAINSEG